MIEFAEQAHLILTGLDTKNMNQSDFKNYIIDHFRKES